MMSSVPICKQLNFTCHYHNYIVYIILYFYLLQNILDKINIHIYSGPSLIGPPYLPRNWGHIRGGIWKGKKVNTLTVVAEEIDGLIREGGLC